MNIKELRVLFHINGAHAPILAPVSKQRRKIIWLVEKSIFPALAEGIKCDCLVRGASSSGGDGRVSVRAGARRRARGVRLLRHQTVRAAGGGAQGARLFVRHRRQEGKAPRHRAADQVRRVRGTPGKGMRRLF